LGTTTGSLWALGRGPTQSASASRNSAMLGPPGVLPMTARNLDALVSPTSIALVGATDRPGSVGRVLLERLMAGGFSGPILPVNPSRREGLGLPCVARLGDLAVLPDLVVVAVPAPYVPGIIVDAGAAGGRAAVVITAGLTEANGLRRAMLD